MSFKSLSIVAAAALALCAGAAQAANGFADGRTKSFDDIDHREGHHASSFDDIDHREGHHAGLFDDIDHGDHHTGLSDDFDHHVTAIPEPESYVLMLAGLGVVGLIVRRRRRSV